jgi:hypothetical protein
MLRRLPLLAALTMVAGLSSGAPAVANPGEGAQVVETPFSCREYPIGTVCAGERSVFNVTETASGTFISSQQFEIQTTLTTPQCQRSDSRRGNQHYMLTSGELLQSVFNERWEFSFDCGEGEVTCIDHFLDVWANGEVRHEIADIDCEVSQQAAAATG